MKSPEYFPIKMGGVVLDLPPEEVSPEHWTQALNVHFKDQATERSPGYASYADPLPLGAQPTYILPVQTPDLAYWLYTTDDKIYVTDGVTHTDITPVSGVQPTPLGNWTGGLINGLPFLNNGLDVPVYWDLQLSNVMQILPGWDTIWRCEALRSVKYHLVAMNMTINSVNFPDLLQWSSAADPGTMPQSWTAAPDNDAGNAQLSDTAGPIIDGGKLRDAFIVYKSQSTYIMEYVAGQYVFNLRALFVTSGIQGTNCVSEVDGYHYVMANDDIIKHDGNTIESLGTWTIKETLFGSINPDAHEACTLSARQSTDEVWCCIPEAGEISLTLAYVINTKTGEIGSRGLPNISHIARGIVPHYGSPVDWDSDSESWDSDLTTWIQATYSLTSDVLLMSDYVNGRLLELGASDSNDGVDMGALVERTGLIVEAPGIERIFWTQCWPRITGQQGDTVQVRIGGQAHFDEPVSWGQIHDYVIGGFQFVPVRTSKRYLAIRISSVGGKVWKLHGFTMAGTRSGLY